MKKYTAACIRRITTALNHFCRATGIMMLTTLLTAVLVVPCFSQEAVAERPNIIFILADDLGYGDLSCYGQKRFQTPNIDRMATEGLRFTRHYSGSPVCAPSRSALMTGLHSGHTPIRGNKEVKPEGQWPLPDEAQTLTELLKSTGYVTGVFGKWGLGYPGSEGSPGRQGVDSFFGYNCQRLAHNYYPEYLWDNGDKVYLNGNNGYAKEDYAPHFIHKKALEFLDDHRDTSFFLFYPMVLPHAELTAPEAYMKLFRGKFLPEVSYKGVDSGETFRKGPYGSQEESHAAFAAMIHLMDEQVGQVLDKVRALGLENRTLIIFTSDNGPHQEGGADPDYFDSNGTLRGYKRDLYEGGIRVPMIARWPGKIKPGVTGHVSAFWDVMPTVAELTGTPISQRVDGISYLPVLLGNQRKQKKHDHLYWEFHELGQRRALLKGDWKLVQYNVSKNPTGSFELYHVSKDPSETTNVAASFPDKVEELKRIMLAERTPSSAFPFGSEAR